MKKLLLLLIIPFVSFGQCIEGDLDNDGICDEIDDCVGLWIADVTTGNCDQFTSQGADVCSSYLGCEWTYSWGGWVTGGSSDCTGTYEIDDGYCEELGCDSNEVTISVEGVDSLIGWNIAQDNGWAINSGGLGVLNACIYDGCWNFNMYDGASDGWEETYYNIYYTNTNVLISSGTLPEGNFCGLQIQIGETISCSNTFGCTDFSACNYNCSANTDDGSCDYDCVEQLYCSQLSVSDVVIDYLNMTIDLAIYDGNMGGSAYPYIAYTIDNLGDTIQTGNINSFGNLGLDTSWYSYALNSLPTYPLTICYTYGMDSNTCIFTYTPTPTSIEETALNKKLISTIDILGRTNRDKGFQLKINDDGSVEKKYLIE